MKPDLLIICFSDLKKDPRAKKQINLLSQYFKITAVGYGSPEIEGVDFLKLQPQTGLANKARKALSLKLLNCKQAYWQPHLRKVLKKILEKKYSLIISNDLNTLPLAVEIKKHSKAKLLFDAHEYFPEQFSGKFMWDFFFKKYSIALLEEYLPHVDKMCSVGDSICERFASEFNISKPFLCRNTLPYTSLNPSLSKEVIQFVHLGAALPFRKLETMIQIFKKIDKKRFNLNFMLVHSNQKQKKYLDYLKSLSRNYTNIKFLDPVSHDKIASFCNKFDVGFHVYQTDNFNNQYCLPNKFFECIQSRLGIITNASSYEMTNYVSKYKIGLSLKDGTPDQIAKQLESISIEDVQIYKKNAHKHAYTFSAESEMSIFLEHCSELIPSIKKDNTFV